MDELKIIKSMFNEGKISRKEAKKLIKTVLSSEINDKYYQATLKTNSVKIKIIAEKEEEKANVDINISLKFLNLLKELKTDEDQNIDFNFNGNNFNINLNDIVNLADKLQKEGKNEDFIEIRKDDGSLVKIYIYL